MVHSSKCTLFLMWWWVYAAGSDLSSTVCCAGVPGMVGGMLRHMRSLRTMKRECAPDPSLSPSTGYTILGCLAQ